MATMTITLTVEVPDFLAQYRPSPDRAAAAAQELAYQSKDYWTILSATGTENP